MSPVTLQIEPAPSPSDAASPQPSARAALVARLAARISASTGEIAPFASAERAIATIAGRVFRDRRVVLAQPVADRIARSARDLARATDEADWRDARADAPRGSTQATAFESLARTARNADALVLTSPFLAPRERSAAFSPRDLLRLRARATRPVIVLDLLDEDLARVPLTQAALLIPGTIVLRGFGQPWREAGAVAAANLAFVAGAPDLVGLLSADDATGGVDDGLAASVVEELDRAGIERAVQSAAARARVPFRGD